MISYNLTISDDKGLLNIGPFHADTWPLPGDILKMDLTLESEGDNTRHINGPRFDVTDCYRDDRQVMVKRHVGE